MRAFSLGGFASAALALLCVLGGTARATVPAPVGAPLSAASRAGRSATDSSSDIVVIGAGIAGLSAALEAARLGASVTIVEVSSVAGGHAVLSNGAVCLSGTPLQQRSNISDNADLLFEDIVRRGGDADPGWARSYAERCRLDVHDWLIGLGVAFDAVVKPPGNSVARLHLTKGKGLGLVGPIYRAVLEQPSVRFAWNTRAERLMVDAGRVIGVDAVSLRTRERRRFKGTATIVATGGFQGNLQTVRRNWPASMPRPERLLAGGGYHADGSGHELVREAGGRVERLDHQWNYVLGLPDPRDSSGERGLAAFNFAGIWVNAEGRRFVREFGDPAELMRTLLRQQGQTYWTIFDESGKASFSVTLAGWESFAEIDDTLLQDRRVMVSAPSVRELAQRIGIPAETLEATVRRYNELTGGGVDLDFQAFGPRTTPKPKPIATGPFHAVQFFPITRKSMGGVKVDSSCRVPDATGRPIPGLYAAGEVTGFGGLNGSAALEGTFLGPGVLMGRIAGRHAAESTAPQRARRDAVVAEGPSTASTESNAASGAPTPQLSDGSNASCIPCHDIQGLVATARPGYWHFERSHQRVLRGTGDCLSCHPGLAPFDTATHRIDRRQQAVVCVRCHGPQARNGPPRP